MFTYFIKPDIFKSCHKIKYKQRDLTVIELKKLFFGLYIFISLIIPPIMLLFSEDCQEVLHTLKRAIF